MEKIVCIINVGSSSKRYALYKNGMCHATLHVRKTAEKHDFIDHIHKITHRVTQTVNQYHESINFFLHICIDKGLIDTISDLNAIGMRIVAPGSYFLATQEITPEYIMQLKLLAQYAPLHIIPIIDELNQCLQWKNIPLFGVCDSAFHATIPEYARIYGIAQQDIYHADIFRFGYHGISAASVIHQFRHMCHNVLPENIIVCHLGSGCSITAIKNGQSIDTSMGYSPNEGLIMATRSGNVNTSAYLKIKDVHNWTDEQMVMYLNQSCGLFGLSNNLSSEIEILLDHEKKRERGLSPVDVFIYHIVKTIGSYIAALSGIDALIFTGGIGEHVPEVRLRVINSLAVFDFTIDEEKNSTCTANSFLQKSDENSSKKLIAVVESQEAQEIFRAIEKLI